MADKDMNARRAAVLAAFEERFRDTTIKTARWHAGSEFALGYLNTDDLKTMFERLSERDVSRLEQLLKG